MFCSLMYPRIQNGNRSTVGGFTYLYNECASTGSPGGFPVVGIAVVPRSQWLAQCRFVQGFPWLFQVKLLLILSYTDSPFAESLYFFFQISSQILSLQISGFQPWLHVRVTKGIFRKPHRDSNLIGLGRGGSGTWASCVLKSPQAIIICKPGLHIAAISECLGLSYVH